MTIESPDGSDARMDMQALGAALRRRWLRIVLVTLLLLGGTYAVLLFVPRSYEATASILVESRDSVYTQPASPGAGQVQPANPDAIISSQIELVKSRDTLLPVVRDLELAKLPEFNGTAPSTFGFLTRLFRKSGKANPEDVAVDALSEHLTVIRERDSALISVIVRSADPALAARLANAIARADVARRAELTLSDTADASQWLEQQVAHLRQRVADAETRVADFKISNDLYTGSNSTSLLQQQMTEVSSQVTAAAERRDAAQSRARLIRGLLAAGQPIDGVDDVRNSVTIQQLMQQKAQLTAQRAQLLATLLPSHPSVAAVTAQLAAIDRQVAVEGQRVADALDAEAKIESSLLDSLGANLDRLKAKVADATRQTVQLDALDREAKADRDLLESYMTRYRDAAARTDVNAALPDVRLLTLATPSSTPASPRTTLILGAVGLLSLAIQVGAILFGELLSGRALIESGVRPVAVPAGFRAADADADVPVAPVPAAVVAMAPPPAVAAPADPGRGEEGEETDLDARMAEEPVPAAGGAPDAAAAATPASGPSLRRWFGRRARAVGSSLTSYEPPVMDAPATPDAPVAPLAPAAAAAPALAPALALPPLRPSIDDTAAPTSFADAAAIVAGEPAGPPAAPTVAADSANALRLANLFADFILGRARIVVLAGVASERDAERLADRLIADALQRGLSVARVDAGSGRPSTEPGLTDLAAEEASFGDVVHRTAQEGLAEIPWGHRSSLDRRSPKPVTLIEALSDLYEVVVVIAGRSGPESSLPMFAGPSSRLVLVPDPGFESDAPAIAEARAAAVALGYRHIEAIAAPPRAAEVA